MKSILLIGTILIHAILFLGGRALHPKVVEKEVLVQVPLEVPKIVEVEKIVEVPVVKYVEVEKIVEVPVKEYIEVEKIVERPTIKYVTKEVPVEKTIYVDRAKTIPPSTQISIEVGRCSEERTKRKLPKTMAWRNPDGSVYRYLTNP